MRERERCSGGREMVTGEVRRDLAVSGGSPSVLEPHARPSLCIASSSSPPRLSTAPSRLNTGRDETEGREGERDRRGFGAPGAMAAATLGKAGEEEAVAADGEVPLLPSRCIQNGDDERPISVAMVLRTTEASLLLPLLQVTAEPHRKEIGLVPFLPLSSFSSCPSFYVFYIYQWTRMTLQI